MDKKIKFSGITNFLGKDINYDFDGNMLNLYVDNEIYHRLTMKEIQKGVYTSELQKLDVTELECSINGSEEKVIFLFNNCISKSQAKNYTSFTIGLLIKEYIIYSSTNIMLSQDSYYKMNFYSKDFYRFLSLTPIYNVRGNDDKTLPLASVLLNEDAINQKCSVEILGFDVEISPSYKYNWGGSNFDFTPGISLVIKNPLKFNYTNVFKFYHGTIKLLWFLFMRKNIFPTDVEFTYFGAKGKLYTNCYSNSERDKENPNDCYSGYIYWYDSYTVVGNILKAIIENDCLMNNIPNSKIERLYINDVSISKDAAEFEYEFKKIFPNGIPHSEERLKIEEEIREELTHLKNNCTGKKKDYYKQFLKHIRQESLKGNMKYMFEQNSELLKEILCALHCDMTYDEISEECSGVRNTIDHGKDDRAINETSALSFLILRILIYIMQLRRFGLKDENIKNSIFNLLRIKGSGVL